MMGLGKGTVTPFKNGNYWYQFVRFLGCKHNIRLLGTINPTSSLFYPAGQRDLRHPSPHHQTCATLKKADQEAGDALGINDDKQKNIVFFRLNEGFGSNGTLS